MLGIGSAPLKINVSGCSLGSLHETLPKTPRSSFTGVGSTSEAMKSFNLQVNCQGTTLVKLSINANNPFTSGVGVGQPAATSGTTAGAGGMGIQLLSGASGDTPWNFDNAMTLNEANVGESGNTAFAVPLRARYYQTAATVRPGRLTVGFTVTFQYE
nr:fimbrial protein [Bordetella trematum]